ncbi:phenylacetate--CoA ligase family protein [Lentzea albidocapillata]|nr:phenylacetate--CoA ligase family protein [Lentzea albidocapillata]
MRTIGASAPDRSFYDRKLASVWNRAKKSAAYGDLGDFSMAALRGRPVTTKDAIKSQPWDYIVADLGAAAKYYETTGTSGQVTPTPRLAEDIIWNVASVSAAWQDVLADDDRVLVLLPSDVVPVADLIVNVCEHRGLVHTRAYPFATGITDWDRLLGLFAVLRPTVVFAAPGVVMQLSRLLKQRGQLPDVSASVRSLMLLGEVSTAAMRERLGAWWGATAFDASYGSTETGTLAATCVHGNLHLLLAANHFELATGRGVVGLSEGDRGRLVVTPLNLHARPLIKLDTGDDVVVTAGCACGSPAPVVTVSGRSAEALSLRGSALTLRAVEDVVYRASSSTGYLIELDRDGGYGRLLLERDIDADRATEPAQREAVQEASATALGLRWDDVSFVNTLPATTKSGGSQKSWKRSNIRIVEPAR